MSNWLPDLSARDGPRYQALADAIAEGIACGALRPGERLPTRRDLALRLGISVNTVSAAYLEAERRGQVSGEVGRGTFVLPAPSTAEGRFFLDGRPSDLADLSICRPCQDPRLIRLAQDGLAGLGRDSEQRALLACRPIVGFDAHRRAAARWLGGLGLTVSPERVVLTNGCAHALMVSLLALVEPGMAVATESLTDHGLISLSHLLHLNLVPLATDQDGIVPDVFEAACREQAVRVLVATPTLTNPTCTLMSADRRRAIAGIARDHDVAVVEDDVFAALVPDRPPPLAVYCPERAFYFTSFTKVALSGLRTGYLVGPDGSTHRLAARVRSTSWMATPLVAELATRWIEDGTMAELVDWQRGELAARQALVGESLAGSACQRHANGLNVWLPLPPPWRAENFVDQARLRGVLISSAEPFVVGRLAEPHAVRLSVGSVRDRDELKAALLEIRALLGQSGEPAYLDV